MYLERITIPHARASNILSHFLTYSELEETYSDFSAFVTKYNNDDYQRIMSVTTKTYGKSLKALRERELYELQLSRSSGSFEVFSAYLEWEQSSAKVKIPELIQTLFERALVTFWQQPSIWEDYATFGVMPHF